MIVLKINLNATCKMFSTLILKKLTFFKYFDLQAIFLRELFAQYSFFGEKWHCSLVFVACKNIAKLSENKAPK